MSIFGVSNWSLPRLVEAKAYAEANGLNNFSLVSNQFSLARILEALLDGCGRAAGRHVFGSQFVQGVAALVAAHAGRRQRDPVLVEAAKFQVEAPIAQDA